MMTSDWLLFALNTLVLLVVALGFATVSLRWIRSETKEVAVRLEKLEALLREELAGSTDSLGARIEGVQAALEKDVAGVAGALGPRIEGVQTVLEKEVAGVAHSLGPRIEGVQTALEKSVTDASKDLASGIAEVKTELGNVEVRLQASVDGATDSLSETKADSQGEGPRKRRKKTTKTPPRATSIGRGADRA